MTHGKSLTYAPCGKDSMPDAQREILKWRDFSRIHFLPLGAKWEPMLYHHVGNDQKLSTVPVGALSATVDQVPPITRRCQSRTNVCNLSHARSPASPVMPISRNADYHGVLS